MGGSVKFEDALAARLGVMHPSRAKLQAFLDAHPARLSPGAWAPSPPFSSLSPSLFRRCFALPAGPPVSRPLSAHLGPS